MLYTLRNQQKIASVFGHDILKLIVKSLDEAFKESSYEIEYESRPFPILDISAFNSSDYILFYVVKVEEESFRLAFKEIIKN